MPDPISYFDDLEDHIQSLLKTFEAKIPGVNDELIGIINDLYSELDRTGTNINASVNNLKALNSFKTRISTTLENGSYGDAVKDFVSGYSSSADYLNNYFSAVSSTFKQSDALYNAILQSNIQSTTQSLLGSGVDANFTDPVMNILRNQITTGSSKAEFTQSLKDVLIGDNSILHKYASQVSSDSISQFNSNYINTVSKDLGLAHYYYKGTKISDTRDFCRRIAGKYIAEDDLKKYVQQQMLLNGGKGWQGMVKGENWTTFPIYRGGYNCRHYLIPVSKELYDAATNIFYI